MQQMGEAAYTVLVEVSDVLECGAVAMPFEGQNGSGYFLQLYLRTLDGKQFRSGTVQDSTDEPWRAVFRLSSRDELYEAARIIIDALPDSGAARELPESSRTSVPFSCRDCFEEYELQKAKQAAASRSGGSPKGSGKNWLSDLSKFLGGKAPAESSAPAPRPAAVPAQPSQSQAARPSSPQAGSAALLPTLIAGTASQTLLSPEMADCIAEYLPVHLRLPGSVEWVLRYSPKKHGVSLATLYRNMEGYQTSVILIQDTQERVFGGFAPATWEPKHKFYGSGEAFVFAFTSADLANPHLQMYPWTSKNTFVMYGDSSTIAMGGGEGRHAFAVHSDLLRGLSSPTPTFANPTLATAEEYVIRDLEVWALEMIET